MIRVFIATGDAWRDHEPVLEHSIRSNTSSPVQINWMRAGEKLKPSGCTGFTNFRFAIPELAGGHGFAIYLDVDMVVLGDIAELWGYRKAGWWVCLKDGSTEVSVIDCRLRFPPQRCLHHWRKDQLLNHVPLKREIPPEWNVEDRVEPGMKLLHFTDLKQQPWLGKAHSNAEALGVLREYQDNYAQRARLGVA